MQPRIRTFLLESRLLHWIEALLEDRPTAASMFT